MYLTLVGSTTARPNLFNVRESQRLQWGVRKRSSILIGYYGMK
jgi:hypothetical protein